MLENEDKVAFHKFIEFCSPTIDQHFSAAELKMWRANLITEKIIFDSELKINYFKNKKNRSIIIIYFWYINNEKKIRKRK